MPYLGGIHDINTVLRMPTSFVRTGIVPASRFADADMLARAAAAAVEAGRPAPVVPPSPLLPAGAVDGPSLPASLTPPTAKAPPTPAPGAFAPPPSPMGGGAPQ